MDSMRSLNRSLPSTPPSRPAPPEQLLQAFRQAALSVTNLYKSAAGDHESIRQAGYQDAIDDLLKFLDRENLGVQDGEGWTVRQWATARYDGSHVQHGEGDEDETPEEDDRYRSNSPERSVGDEPANTTQAQVSADSNPHNETHNQSQQQPEAQPVFHFSAGTENSMQTDDSHTSTSSNQEQTPPVRVEVTSRANRNANKHNNRHPPRSAARITSQTVGSKRKLPFPDISEIFNVGFDKKDGFDGGSGGGGSKRSRFV